MNGMPAGARARFKTDSAYMIIKVETPSITPYTAGGSITAMKGFDLYITDSQGEERYYQSSRPPVAFEAGYEAILELPEGMKDITLYFPMYNQVSDLYIGLQEKAALLEGSGYKVEKPILFYGSSITQGCCVSRTGNIYSSILGRLLNCDTINLVFPAVPRDRSLPQNISVHWTYLYLCMIMITMRRMRSFWKRRMHRFLK